MTNVTVLLFDGFTALDAVGPLDVLGRLEGYAIRWASLAGGPVSGSPGLTVETEALSARDKSDILLIPGGFGTRKLAGDTCFLAALQKAIAASSIVMTVCTGSALAAACGALDGRHATGNKKAFTWTMSVGPNVLWEKDARWTKNGKFYTADGVSAGMDMALGYAADRFGTDKARSLAANMEYRWNDRAEDGWCFLAKNGK